MTSVSTRLLFIWLLCIIAGTLAPFDFGVTPVSHGLKVFEFGSDERDPMHFLFNMLLFVPLGGLLHHDGRQRSLKLRSIVILAGTAGLLISMTVEYFQAFLPIRDSSLIDVLANTSGSLMGVAADRAWGVPVETLVTRLRTRTSSVTLAGLVVGFLIVALAISGALQARTRLSNWSAEYPLLIGNERTGDRLWRGRVFALTMTDAATPIASVHRFSTGEPVVLPGARIAAFDLTGNAPYGDAAGNVPALERTERPTFDDSGVRLPQQSWLQSVGPASRLAQRLKETNAFTLRVECAADDIDQDGPARIVSNSVSTLFRNFTLGQQGSDLVFRLRTPSTGVNGYPLEVFVPGVFSDHRSRDILVTYDGTTLLVAMANDGHVSRTELTPGSSVALAMPSLNVRPDELQMYNVAYVAALSLVPAVLVGLLGHTNRDRYIFGVGWVLALAVLLEATLVRVSGRRFDWGNVIVIASVGAVVFIVFGVTLSQPDLERPQSARALRPVSHSF